MRRLYLRRVRWRIVRETSPLVNKFTFPLHCCGGAVNSVGRKAGTRQPKVAPGRPYSGRAAATFLDTLVECSYAGESGEIRQRGHSTRVTSDERPYGLGMFAGFLFNRR